MGEIKQVIVMRKDLHCRAGKIASQVAHASMKVILDMMQRKHLVYPVGTGMQESVELSLMMDKGTPIYEWLNGSFAKIVLYVEFEDAIHALANRCHFMKIPCAVITDAGKTEFHGEPTVTCIAIGPDYSEKIDKITGDLPLL